ncbi:DnaJ C-terminal domain-containing protein [Alterisphingorhabdus coralli]|uniref:DnaJ C-terminal domain-containing protein n=1 Tax=Alterisphingorhabdus coralli TaxID=3071408 RepID=A0AA97I2X0_9SPHN|nr:DnaJ C-terminal domain-containing protein [Parasphingorhabdus sp. SCSIO 66989]WOE76683.1 DnaJ C-terminal domain-containing protein [Parasphingorhabdus sp. SCSIO 66989]
MADPYKILGVARGASEKDIKSAYRKLAKELHPDRNKDNPKAAERFSEVTQAYDLLTDSDKRARFDRGEIDIEGNPTAPFGFGGGAGGYHSRSQSSGGDFGGFGNDGIDFADIFDGLFGGGGNARSSGFGGRQPPSKGANVGYQLTVDFISAATLAPQTVTLSDGKTVSIKLPVGVETGSKIRLTGKGQPGAAGPGDAIVTITIGKHPHFRRDEDDVLLDLPISLTEAVKGGKIKIPTVDGPVMMTLKAGSTGGQVMRLKGKGFHRKGGGRGDQMVTLRIAIPEDDAALDQFVDSWSSRHDPRAHFQM